MRKKQMKTEEEREKIHTHIEEEQRKRSNMIGKKTGTLKKKREKLSQAHPLKLFTR